MVCSHGLNRKGIYRMSISHIFISYSRKDKVVVGKFVNDLQMNDFVVWQDVSNIRAGEDWWDKIKDAIEKSSVFLIFCSHASSMSDTVQRELDYAKTQNIWIIPIWLEKDTRLGKELGAKDAIDSRKLNAKLIEALLPLASRIQRQVFDFNLRLPMNAQTDIKPETIGDREFVVFQLIKSAYSNVHIIAEAGTIPQNIRRIQVIVQTTGNTGYAMVKQVFHTISLEDKEHPEQKQPLLGIYITGAKSTLDDKKYEVDDRNVAHRSDLSDTLNKALSFFTKDDRDKVFQMFLYALVDIGFLMGVKANRYHEFQMYKREGNDKYIHVIDIPSREQQS